MSLSSKALMTLTTAFAGNELRRMIEDIDVDDILHPFGLSRSRPHLSESLLFMGAGIVVGGVVVLVSTKRKEIVAWLVNLGKQTSADADIAADEVASQHFSKKQKVRAGRKTEGDNHKPELQMRRFRIEPNWLLGAPISKEKIGQGALLVNAPALARFIDRNWSPDRHFLNCAMIHVAEVVRTVDPTFQISGRIKSSKSAAIKQRRFNTELRAFHDKVGVRVLVSSVAHCFSVIEGIHRGMNYLGHLYDDYISAPKANGYQSLHTTIVTTSGWPFELQVRTRSMHACATYGGAAHDRYKTQLLLEQSKQSFGGTERTSKS